MFIGCDKLPPKKRCVDNQLEIIEQDHVLLGNSCVIIEKAPELVDIRMI